MAHAIPFKPHKFQWEFLNAWRRFNVLVCHRRFGKTDLAVAKLIMAALTVTTIERQFAYICPLKKQAKDNSWPKFTAMLANLVNTKVAWKGKMVPLVKLRDNDCEVKFYNGAVIKLFGADKGGAEAIRGASLAGCVMDEVGDIDAMVWDEIVQPTLNSTQGWALFIGTPKGPNLFRDLYEYAIDDTRFDAHEWHGACYKLSDTYQSLFDTGIAEFNWCSPYGMQALLSRYEDRKQKYQREYECDFEASAEDAIIPIEIIRASMLKDANPSDYRWAERVLSVDVARFGADGSTICRREGLHMPPVRVFQGLDNMELADQVATAIDEFRPDATFIDAGRGEGVIDRLRQLGYKVVEINFGAKAANPIKYYNKRTEMYFSVYEWIKRGGCLPKDKQLERELGVATYDDENEKFRMCKKSVMKAKLNGSPDSSDAVALSFALPVRRKVDGHVTHARTTSSPGYSPFKRRNRRRR